MKEQNEKQAIEEMVKISRHVCEGECFINKDGLIDCDVCRSLHFYDKGYRKQSVGEWKFQFTLDDDDFYECSICGRQEVINGLCYERNPAEHFPYCHCGARMKGGEE